LPNYIFPKEPLKMANIGGDLATLIFHAFFWWFVFILIERTPKGYFEKFYSKNIEKKVIEDLDPDVVKEQKRVEEKCA